MTAQLSLAESFAGLDAATVYEASGLPCACDPGLKPVWSGARVCGPAFTVRCRPGDNLALHRALERVDPGAVLVVDAGGHLAGHWGEVLAVAAQVRGVAGLVIDGGLRDVVALQDVGFPAFARGAAVFSTTKHDPGIFGERIVLGGVVVEQGDLVLGDADGVVVVPRAAIIGTRERALDRVRKESDHMAHIRAGRSTLDLYGLRATGAGAE